MLVVIVATITFAALAINAVRFLGVSRLSTSMGLVGLAVLLHFLSYYLHMLFIRRRAPHLVRESEGLIHTSASRFVPRWVKEIHGLVIGALIAALLPWVVALLSPRSR